MVAVLLKRQEEQQTSDDSGVLYRELRKLVSVGDAGLRELLREAVEAGLVECKWVPSRDIVGRRSKTIKYFLREPDDAAEG